MSSGTGQPTRAVHVEQALLCSRQRGKARPGEVPGGAGGSEEGRVPQWKFSLGHSMGGNGEGYKVSEGERSAFGKSLGQKNCGLKGKETHGAVSGQS